MIDNRIDTTGQIAWVGRSKNMCYYCRYLAHEGSTRTVSGEDFRHAHHCDGYLSMSLHPTSPSRSCHLTLILRLVGITLFFLLLNITIVLSQSSQIQQHRDQSSSNILQTNSQGNHLPFLLILVEFNFLFLILSSMWARSYLMKFVDELSFQTMKTCLRIYRESCVGLENFK